MRYRFIRGTARGGDLNSLPGRVHETRPAESGKISSRRRAIMLPLHFWARVQGRYIRSAARLFFKRPLAIKRQVPLSSFTFDEFPRSASHTGGAILSLSCLSGTLYDTFCLQREIAPSRPLIT